MTTALPLHGVRATRVLKQDSRFQLQRLTMLDGQELLAKFAHSSGRDDDERLLRREFQLFEQLASPHVLKPIRLAQQADKLVAVYDDFDGSPLEAPATFDVQRFLEVSRALCATLGALHRAGQVLVGMAPSSFLRHRTTGTLVLADAPFASNGEDCSGGLRVDSAYLPYAAPEVVGRAELAVDQRADLYALGAILYQLVARRPPFAEVDAAEIIQAHLAKRPPSIIEHEPGVSPALDRLLLKLLSKAPSDRYDDIDDLERALAGLETKYKPEPAAGLAGSRDGSRPRVPVLSSKLYGRSAGRAALIARIEQSHMGTTFLLVSGEAGVGKTALARDVEPLLPLSRPLSAFKFKQDETPAPLSCWATVLRDLADVVLTSTPAELDVWRTNLVQSLGDGAMLIGGLVPEWSAVLGSAELPGADERDGQLNGLAVAVHGLLRCYAVAGRPVALFLDDLQWADAASLRILELVLCAPESAQLLVLATARKRPQMDGNVSREDELCQRLASAKVGVEVVELRALAGEDVQLLIEDSFPRGIADLPGLLEVTMSKTGGSPIFVREFLKLLLHKGLLRADNTSDGWTWDRAAISELPPVDSVVDFLVEQIRALPASAQGALRIAACLGMRFRAGDYLATSQREASLAVQDLELAVQRGLLTSDDASRAVYEFPHDRIIEACLASMTSDERKALHLRVARALSKLPPEQKEARLHELAGHFNRAHSLLLDAGERSSLAELNLRAGKQAKERGAFGLAMEFFMAGLTLLSEPVQDGDVAAWTQRGWVEHFPLTLELHGEAAEAAVLDANLEVAHGLCDAILDHARLPLQKIQAYEVRIGAFKAAKEFSSAVGAAREVLRELGVSFPKHPGMLRIAAGFLLTKRRILSRSMEHIAKLPEMRDIRAKAIARVIQAVYPAAYFGEPQLFPLLVYHHVQHSLLYGTEDYSAVTFSAFAVVLCEMGDFDHAMKLGEISLQVLQRYDAPRLKARVFAVHYLLIFPWRYHLRDALPHCHEGTQSGLQNGDFEFASYLMTIQALAKLHSGVPLHEFEEERQGQLEKIRSLGQERSVIQQQILCQLTEDLRELSGTRSPLSGRYYDEKTMLKRCFEPLDHTLVFHHYLAKLILGIYLGDASGAVEGAILGRKHIDGAFGNYLGAVFCFYESLAFLAAPPRRARLRQVGRNRKKLRAYAQSGPANFSHKHQLVEALWACRRGQVQLAAECFERAIEAAQAEGFIHEAALAQELAAKFYFGRELGRLGRQYLRDCHTGYRRWGANAVARRIESSYAQEFALLGAGTSEATFVNFARLPEDLDYRVLLQSSQAISSEVRLPQLLARLLKTVLEHAGAQRGLLLLDRDGQMHVEAEADVDHSQVAFHRDESVEDSERLSQGVARYVVRTKKAVALLDASREGPFRRDPYVLQRRPKSVLCVPILHQAKLLGLVYLENNRVSHLFTSARVDVVNLLASQAGISLANARFHAVQMEAQQAKINPHFLFNALSSIASVAVQDALKTEEAIVQLANLYRYILVSAGQVVGLDQELATVSSYIVLEKLRFGEKLGFSLKCDGDAPTVKLPGLLIQPLVENAIRHGIAPKLGPGRVSVDVVIGTDRCSISVQDDGDGAKPTSHGTGFGLRSVQERLALVYGSDYSFAISQRHGYRVEIEVPLGVSEQHLSLFPRAGNITSVGETDQS